MSSLMEMLEKAVREFNALPPEEREKHLEEQRKSYVRAEMSWPKPRFKFVNGVKVYESYEDYVNG